MVDAAAEFKKSGYSDEDAKQLAIISQMYTNVADEALSAGESANFIISQMKAFNLEASEASHIIDAVNNVSNNLAVSSSDLATNIGNASAALAQGGNTYEEVLALMTGIVEITRSGAKASRGLVSIQSRYNQLVDESSDTGKALSEWYEKHNIAIYDQAGQLRKLYSVLGDVAKIWPDLTKNERAYYLNQQAGANQTQNLAAVLQNMDHVTKAYNLAINSSGSAMAENEKAVASLEGRTNLLKAEFQDLANNVIPNELIKELLNLGASLLELINNPIGRFLIQWGLVSGVVGGAGTVFILFASKIVPMVVSALGTLTVAGVSAQAAFGWISIVIGGLAALAISLSSTSKEVERTGKTISERKEEISELNDELEANKSKINELNSIDYKDRSASWQNEYNQLRIANDELERKIRLEKMAQAGQQVALVKNPRVKFEVGDEPTRYKVTSGVSILGSAQYLWDKYFLGQDVESDWYKPIQKVFDSMEEAEAFVSSWGGTIEEFTNKQIKTIEGYNDINSALREQIGILSGAVDGATGDEINQKAESYLKLRDGLKDIYNNLKDLQTLEMESGGTQKYLTDEQREFISVYEQASNVYVKFADTAQTSTDNLKAMFADLYPEIANGLQGVGIELTDLAGEFDKAGASVRSFLEELAYIAKMKAATAGRDIAKIYAIPQSMRYQFADELAKLEAERDAAESLLASIEKAIPTASSVKLSSLKRKNDKSSSGAGVSAEDSLKKFNEALKLLDHQLAMDQISTEEYYASLQKLMDAYLQDADNQETLWKYQEKIYSWKKKAAEDEQSAQEKINSELQKQIELQEKLRDAAEALAKAQQKRILVFRKSGYGYMQDVGAISEAQGAYAKVKSGYAGGTVYSSAGLHMFGENGPELGVIGSGNGVLPSEITRNLWEWGAQRPEEMLASVPASGGDTISFSGVTMAFPNVRSGSDAQGFMESLVMLARQRAYKRY